MARRLVFHAGLALTAKTSPILRGTTRDNTKYTVVLLEATSLTGRAHPGEQPLRGGVGEDYLRRAVGPVSAALRVQPNH